MWAHSVYSTLHHVCTNRGRYCAPDPRQDFTKGYDGKDVVVGTVEGTVRLILHLRHACVYRVVNETDIDLKKVDNCIGDPDADVENPILKAAHEFQIGNGSRKLEKEATLKAMRFRFSELTKPAICLTEYLNTNECLENNGGCWQDTAANITACRDTYRGRLCECHTVQACSQRCCFHLAASEALHCGINNGGCWRETRGSYTYSASVDDHLNCCKCPLGFKGGGVKSCEGTYYVASIYSCGRLAYRTRHM
ncbi:unnamed protein product [Eruca vesicaria subsp. sativa]|uniref:Vacuolar sorting receptor thioredoxin-like domain-containing protein n=1 Tax=Eruca vesicaria subsp. sativa TaxID=29727 RepID=A0ABC8KGC6_ERUVS|nr:unnamed protein product [Eruca vesicaria subsp. sativa]